MRINLPLASQSLVIYYRGLQGKHIVSNSVIYKVKQVSICYDTSFGFRSAPPNEDEVKHLNKFGFYCRAIVKDIKKTGTVDETISMIDISEVQSFTTFATRDGSPHLTGYLFQKSPYIVWILETDAFVYKRDLNWIKCVFMTTRETEKDRIHIDSPDGKFLVSYQNMQDLGFI